MIANTLDFATRVLVVVALAYATTVAVTAWAVRSRRINPFGAWARAVRRMSEPLLRPLERRVVSLGGNPQDASLWMVGIAIVGGLLLLSFLHWAIGFFYTLLAMSQAGPRTWLRFAVSAVFSILMLALFVRVIASWIGLSPYGVLMRPVMILTNWIIEPLRRLMPATGMLDFTPMVAWLVLWLARNVILGFL